MADTAAQPFKIEPTPGGVGAFVQGIDLANDLSSNTVGALRQALGDHCVLFFRDQKLTPDQHIEAAEKFGEINVNRFFSRVPTHDKIALVVKEPDQTANIGGAWHTDHSYDQIPAMGSMLLARQTPTRGGDTLFANMYAAYDSLSDGLKQTLNGLRAVHSSRHRFGPNAQGREGYKGRLGNAELAQQDAVHPVVISHPISGRKALYVNDAFTLQFEGWTKEESEPLLKMLYAHASRPEHTYRFQWAPGSIAFWDNRASWHYAVNDYHGARREMHRITLEGEALDA
ncbi:MULTISPECIES: TauD/TfdA family dioxygenase [unclassified Minwuia]|jgi:alpha-ketoglutarate-dependent taurine dioxygenase|uniref:TauD/TfdA dioxygenase family protein n=1 Tax=unclassified Minwuia TaxID=2618799 RepID=UPI00247869E5|nr:MULTISPECIES: TauD/TfdA family dioxygenase [unclassified Minwuia]